MNIILKYIVNTIKDRKMRTVVMLLSIVLSTSLLMVSLCVGDSYGEAQRKMARGMAGSATLSVFFGANEAGEQNQIAMESLPELAGVGHAVGVTKTIALYKENGFYENFDIIAADLDALATINKHRLLDGGELTNFSGNQVVLSDRFASKFNISQSDGITLWIGGNPYPFEVAAIAAYDTVFLRHTRGNNALVPIETLSALLGTEGTYSEILVEPTEGVETVALQAELIANLPEQYIVSRIVNEALVEAGARKKSMPFFLISFFSLIMSIFIILSSYKVITLERLPVIGTFRSIGATEKMITKLLMIESLVYGGLGALLGIPIGFGVLRLLLNGLGDSLSQGVEIPMIVSPDNIALACGVAIVVSVLSAWIPVRRASRLPIKDVVLGTMEEKNLSNTKLYLVGAVLFVLSLILPQIGKTMGDNALLIMGGFSLVGLLAATIIIIPMVTSGVSRILECIYGAVLGSEARLAARNMRGNKNTNQNITLLFISISAMIAISVVGNFVQVYIGDVFRGAALDGFTDAAMGAEFVEKIKLLDGIEEVLPIRVMSNLIYIDDSVLSRVEGTDNIPQYSEMFAMSYEHGGDNERLESTFLSGRNVLLSADCMKRLGVGSGDTLTLRLNGQEYEYMVLGSYKIRSTNTEAIISSENATKDFGAQNYGIVAYTAPNPDAVMVQIQDLFGSKPNWSRTVEEFAAIMGPSGSGKSTLLYILGGLDNPTSGSVFMNGRDISKFDDAKKSIMRRRSIGFVFQFYNLIPNLTVAENILLPILLDGKKAGEYGRQLTDILEIVGLSDKRTHTPRELSGGQQQRVAIARALISDPEIIFADEPTGNLDSKSGTEILTLLREINQEKGKTILMVTHSEGATQYGNRMIIVCDGVVG